MTAQLSQQDPTDPVDNKEMLAQLAQFSSLSATSESGSTLKAIAEKLDAVIAAQQAAERSNVDIAEELVGLITAQRYFQANAKAVDTATQISQTIINLRT